MEKPERIQLKRTKGWRKPENTIVVSRPRKWGNPFNWQDIAIQPGYETQKELAVIEFRRWLEGSSPYGDCLPKERQWILDHLHELRGKNLACWCRLCDRHKDGKPLDERCPDCDPCHCDPLGEIANK